MKTTFAKMKRAIMNWNDLKLFLAVAENGTLKEAARQLGVSNTTVFRHLNAFEEGIGSLLFDRSKGGYELTETGEEMLVLAQGISNSFDDIDRHIMGKDIQPKGSVKLTAPGSFAYGFLPQYLADFKQLYPDIDIELLVTNQELNMSNRNADIALRVSQSPPEHLVGRQIRSIEWGVYAGTDYLEKFGRPTNVNSLKRHELIGASGTLRSKPAFSWLEKNHSKEITQRCDDLIAMSCLASKNLGLAFLPNDLQRPELQRCFTFEPAGLNSLWILTHPDLRKVERIKIVMRFLTKTISADDRLA